MHDGGDMQSAARDADFVDPDWRLAIGYLSNKPLYESWHGGAWPTGARAILEAIG